MLASGLGAAKIAGAGGEDLARNLDSFNILIAQPYLPQDSQARFYLAHYQEFLSLISPFQSAGIR